METALNEITLVLFTTLAPAGVIGYLMMAVAAVRTGDKARSDAASRYLVVPLVLAISGLIASATHLGTPANALYVLAGVGRSPLSNEVVAAVAFLALGGIYWIASFRDDIPRLFRIVWLAVTAVAGLAFVGFISVAYSVPTVPTWNLPMVPATLWMCGLASGPAVALFGLLLGHVEPSRRIAAAVLALSGAASVANIALLSAEWAALEGIATVGMRAIDLVPPFFAVALAFGLLEAGSLGLCARATLFPFARGDDPFAAARRIRLVRLALLAAGALCVLAACFIVRFSFYAMHLTLGV